MSVADEVLPIEREDAVRAAAILSGNGRQSARDALHIAVMERYSIKTIFSFDRDFDRWPGLERISRT
ncbi:MAG: type II toxin-antitoxin system VapC family toxin [Bryobacterales bacterium]|nr:type II toxin-antitoxin system VapC family toxin [Bryobacterales bacterium]